MTKEEILYLNIELSEIYAKTEVTQYYENKTDHPLELKVKIPFAKEIYISSFKAKIGDKIIESKIMEKEKAKENYNDMIATNSSAFLAMMRENDFGKNFYVCLGNIKPGIKIEFTTYFYQFIDTFKSSYYYCMMTNFPKFNLIEINEEKKESENEDKDKKECEDQDDDENEDGDENIKYKNKTIKISYMNVIANIHLKTRSPLVNLAIEKNSYAESSIKKEYNKDFTECNIIYEKEITYDFINTPLQLYFTTMDMTIPKLYMQYDEKNDETTCVLNFLFNEEVNLNNESLFKTIENININKNNIKEPEGDNNIDFIEKYYSKKHLIEHPGVFIFLIDQSGSMSGEPINLVKEALTLLIQSLPKDSYYQLIGFGSEFKKYDNIPQNYTKKNIQSTKSFIKSLDAELGGTNIQDPLKSIFSDKCYTSIKLPKYVILLTDGEVEDKDEVLNLILQNNSKFFIHSIGLGSSFDKDLIKGAGINGKGSYQYCSELKDLNKTIIMTLNQCMLSIYNYNITLMNKNLNVVKIFENSDKYLLQLSNLFFGFLVKGKIEENEIINFEFENAEEGKKNLNKISLFFSSSKDSIVPLYKLKQGNEISKILFSLYLKKNKDNISIKEEVEIAKKYEIVTENTALFSQYDDDEGDINKEPMESISSEDKSNWKSEFITNNIKFEPKKTKSSNSECYAPSRCTMCTSAPRSRESSRKTDYFQKLGDGISKIGGFFKSIFTKETKESDSKPVIIDNKINEIKSVKDLIFNQDPIDGNWTKDNYFEEVKKVIKDEYEKSYDYIIKKKGMNQNIFYTFIMIYYIINKEKDKMVEYSKIVGKGKNYLSEKNASYDNLVKEIFN